MAVIGLDIGTSGCKAIAYRSDGEALAHAYCENKAMYADGAAEMNADQVWENVKTVLCQCAIQAGEPINGIGISSFGECFVAVDAAGNVLMPSMLYTDTRGSDEIEIMQPFISTTKLMPHGTFTLPKVLWFRKHKAEIFRKVHHLYLFEDFIIFRLTGASMISQSMAARTGLLDIESKHYSQVIMDAAGLSPDLFSTPMLPGTVCGKVHHLQPLDGAVVVTGGQDQVCAALGAGVLEEGDAICGIGTVECITPLFQGILMNDRMVRQGYCCIPYDDQNRYVTFAYNYTGGAAIKWFMQNLAAPSTLDAYTEYERKAASLHNELFVLPHFAGAATPYMDIHARAAILGMTLATTREDIYRAIMEGCCYEMRINLEQLQKGGISVKRLIATGGGAASSLWVQMKADVLHLPIQTLRNPEAGTVGAAMLAALATGVFSNKTEAVESLVQYKRMYEPQSSEYAYYEKKYSKYRLLYPSLKKWNEVGVC